VGTRRILIKSMGTAAAGMLVVMLVVMGSPATIASAQPSRDYLQWSGDRAEWSGTVPGGTTIQIQGGAGSIRAISSNDQSVHVEARRGTGTDVTVEFRKRGDGLMFCAGECRLNDDARGQNDTAVDFTIRVPAGVQFSGSTVDGDITVEGLRSEVTLATINGRVNIVTPGSSTEVATIDGDVLVELPRDEGAVFHATKVSGTIESDFPILSNIGPPPLPNGRPVFASATSPQVVSATIGKGGPDLRVTTVNGNIRLRRRE
jgi:hypothetical protein